MKLVCVFCGCFQERNLFFAKQMVVGDLLRSILVFENTCSYILVSGTEFTAAQPTFIIGVMKLQI